MTADSGSRSEQLLLTAILYRPAALDEVADTLTPATFGTYDHRRIYEAMVACRQAGHTPDFLAVTEMLESRGHDNAVTTLSEVMLASDGYVVTDATGYADRVLHHFRKRTVLTAATSLVQQLHQQPDADPVTLAQAALTNVLDLAGEEKGPKLYADVMESMQDRIDQQRAGIWAEPVVPTGFRDLDYLTGGGFRPAETILIGGRPGSGKTALALQLMHKAARHNLPVLLFSAEMSLTSMVERGIAEMTGLTMDEIRAKHIRQGTFDVLMKVTERMKSMPVGIDDTGGISTDQMLTRGRRFARQHGLSAVFFDYVELAGDARDAGEPERISEITKGLQRIAKDLDVPVIGLSQLSRNVEQRNPPVPRLSDLRYGGEAVADKILMLYRQDYYVAQGFAGLNPDPAKVGVADVYVQKNRNGRTGVASLRFDERSMRFFDLDESVVQEPMAS